MSNYVKLAANTSDQFLGALAQTQENYLKAISAYGEALASTVPATNPAIFGELPTPQETAEANFAFATKLLKQQKDFSEKLIDAFSPKAASAS